MASISNEYFTIKCDDKYQSILENLLDMVTERCRIIRDFFGIDEYRQVKVTLFNDIFDIKDEASKTNKVYEEYALGSFSNKAIGVLVNDEIKESDVKLIVNKIAHQYSHIIFSKIYSADEKPPLWLDEGISQILSGERSVIQNNVDKCRRVFLSRILSRHKEIPKMEYLNNEGTTRGTIGYPRYSGYLMCYFMVNYLLNAKVPDNDSTLDEDALLGKNYNYYDSLECLEKCFKRGIPLKPRYNLQRIITDKAYREEIEKFLVMRTINYFGCALGVKMSAASHKYIKHPKDFIDYIDANVLYGWYDEKGETHKDDTQFDKRYHVGSIEKFLQHSLGTSIEVSKFEQDILERLGYSCSIFIHKDESQDNKVFLQAFVLAEKDGHFYYLKNGRAGISDVYEYGSFQSFLRNYMPNMKSTSTLYELDFIPDSLSFEQLNEYLKTKDEVLSGSSLNKTVRKV